MLKRISPSMIVALIALFFALTGGAYAANKYVITSTKQIKPSVLAQIKGRDGTNGVNGANGASGTNGSPGAAVTNGATGAKGDTGATGAQGPMGPAGPQGVAGAPGAQGPQGVPGPSMTMHTYTLPDKTISPAAIPASDWSSSPANPGFGTWTPASWATVGSAGGYTYSIAWGDAKPYAYSSDWSRPKYRTEARGKIEGNDIASESGGGGSASASDQYQQVYHPGANPGDPPTYTYEYTGTSQYDVDWSGEITSTFSRTDGQVLKLWGHVKVTENACTVSDLKLYVWS